MIYEDEIKEIIQSRYSPTMGNKIENMTTQMICDMLSGVIPQDRFNKDDVYEIMKELHFKQDMHIEYLIGEDEKPTDKIIDQYLVWVMYTKNQ